MAASDAKPVPQKNVAYRVTFPILDADGDLVSGASALDSEVSKDGGTFADCTNEATEIATSSGVYYLDLTATEMNADTVAIIVKTSTSGAKTTTLVMYPEEAGDIRVNVTQWTGNTVTASSGNPDVNIESMDNDVITSTKIAAGAIAKGDQLTGLNDLSAADVNTQVDTALTDIHLDHLLAADYDPASKPGTATALLNELVESDSGVSRFTANALEQAPTGGSAPTAAQIADAVWDEATSGHTSAGTFGEQLKTDVDAILADTNELQTDDVPGLIAALNDISVADVLTTQMTEAYAANGVAPTLAQALFAIHQHLMSKSISGTTATVRQLDNSTTAFAETLNDGTNPTAIERS